MSEQTTEPVGPGTAEQAFQNEEHPANRPVEAGDPMGMTADSAPGDPELMLTILVEEFAMLGKSHDEIMQLFDDPFYSATAGLKQLLGADRVRARVNAILERCGTLRVSVCATEVCA
ncbi:MAG: hypothetical protein QGH42_08580 [Kiritimatiellia bacterium]|jgi:hypothetical protein|nr:hypothetical protein [Kiritimatiellia bacterium]MDP6630431.1 hypothetical protein [Kiritimatiellia bacterium]MDP6809888.1 hypothetical protein [Kiritimatiellia bacterium]MDP7024280.1 hypothetical protein [Kiritimatiellia bacterium]